MLLTVPTADLSAHRARRRGRRGLRSATCCARTGWRSTRRRCGRGRAGSPRPARRAATTPGSSSARCPTAPRRRTSPPSRARRRGCRSARRSSRRSAASARCCRRRSRRWPQLAPYADGRRGAGRVGDAASLDAGAPEAAHRRGRRRCRSSCRTARRFADPAERCCRDASHPAYETLRAVTPQRVGAAAGQPQPDDARRHEHLAAARAGRGDAASWSTRARTTTSTSSGCWPPASDVELVLVTHGHFDHSQAAAGCTSAPARRCARSTRRTATAATRRSSTARSIAAAGVAAGAGHARAHLRLGVVRARRRRGGADRRHDPGPGHDGRRASGRRPRRRTSTRCAGCASSATRRVLPGHGPELPSAAEAAGMYLTHRGERLDQVRAALRDARARRLGPPDRRARLRRRRRRPSGGPPSCPSGPSSPTCATVDSAIVDALGAS